MLLLIVLMPSLVVHCVSPRMHGSGPMLWLQILELTGIIREQFPFGCMQKMEMTVTGDPTV